VAQVLYVSDVLPFTQPMEITDMHNLCALNAVPNIYA